MSMKIDDWEYHSRMLADIAHQSGGTLISNYYVPKAEEQEKKVQEVEGVSTIVGKEKDVLNNLTNLTVAIADKIGIPPIALVTLMGIALTAEEKDH